MSAPTRATPSTLRLVQALRVAEPHHRDALLGAIAGVALTAILTESVDQPTPMWADVTRHVLNEVVLRQRESNRLDEEVCAAENRCTSCLQESPQRDRFTGLCTTCTEAFARIREEMRKGSTDRGHLAVVRSETGRCAVTSNFAGARKVGGAT
jgi:hypothetical protein